MIELKEKRNLNSSHYDNGDGTFQMNAHIGHIHYFNKLGIGDSSNNFRQIDDTLLWDEKRQGWFFEYHSYHPFIPRYSDDWIYFRDVFEGKDQTIGYRAVCNRVEGKLENNRVIYQNAFSKGVDLVVYPQACNLIKAVHIRKKPKTDVFYDFEISFPGKNIYRASSKQMISYQLDTSQKKDFDTNKQLLIGNNQDDGKEWFSYIRPFKCWDDKRSEQIVVNYIVDDQKIFLRKNITAQFLKDSVGDVYCDTTTSYYAGTNDSGAYLTNGVYTTCHNAATGVIYDVGQEWIAVKNAKPYMDDYAITRSFLPVDTSGLTSGANITAASWFLYWSYAAEYSYGTCNLQFVSYSGNNPMQTSDYSYTVYGTTVFGSIAVVDGGSGMSTGYQQATMNASGIANTNKTGTSLFGFRVDGDITATPPPSSTTYLWSFRSANASNSSQRPYLSITYTVSAIGSVNGVPKANIATINGVAIANVKSICGVE
ncbi:MAG: hypothetical protein AB2L12_00995 [Smithellaceae bacterium]